MTAGHLARLLAAGVILFSMAAGAAEAGPHLAAPVAAGALGFALGLAARKPWAPAPLCLLGSALLHPDGILAGVGAGVMVALLLYLTTWLLRPMLR